MFFGKSLLTLSAAAVLTACGGGGTSNVPAETSLSGVVAKGPAVGAKVKVYAVANGVKGGLLTETTTIAGGSYVAKFPRQSGPVLIEADLNGADITNEVNISTTFKGKPGDVMKAVFVPGTGATQVANVTPFSHMAAVAAANLTANEVLAANAVVRQILGNKDFLTVSPTAATGESLLPVLTELAARSVDSSGSQINDLLGELAGAIVKNGNVYEPSSSASYAVALCGASPTTECTEAFADVKLVVPVSPSANLVAVESAKALFKDLYDTFTSIETTGDLQKSSDGLTAASAMAVAFIDDDQMKLVGSVINGVDLLDSYKTQNGPSSDLDSNCWVGIVTGLDSNGQIVAGTLLSTTNQDFTTTTANAVFCNGQRYRFNGTIVRSDTNGNYVNPEIYNQLILLSETNGQLSYASRVRVVGAFIDATSGPTSGTDGFILGGRASIQYGTATVTDTSATLVGKLAPSAQIAIRKGVTDWNKYAYHDINLTGSATGTEVNGEFEPSSVTLGGAIKLINKDTTEASSLNIVSGSVSATALNINVNAQAPGIKIEGIITGTGTNAEPTALTFTGSIYEADTAAGFRKLLEGKVEATALSANGGNIKFTGQLLLKDRQPIVATLSGSDIAGVLSNQQVTFAWNGKSFTITEVLVNNVATGIKVASSNGVNFEVPSTSIGPNGVRVKVGSDEVGTLFSSGRINFADGSYLEI